MSVALPLWLGQATLAQRVEGPPAVPPPAEIAAAIETWLASDHQDEELAGEAVDAILVRPKIGLPLLAPLVADVAWTADNVDDLKPRQKALRELGKQVVLDFLRKQRDSGMVFVGQHRELTQLQPFAGDLLFALLLDTPAWYPFTHRTQLVAPLRDLHPRAPSTGLLDAAIQLAADEREPLDLRYALAAMLHAWGKPRLAKQFVKELQANTADGDGEDRVGATLQLADYYNLLRDYKAAAGAHRTAQALAKSSGVLLRPVAWYSAACVHALRGDTERGMKALQKCASLLSSPDLDSSLRLERKLFELDPEIAALRAMKEFDGVLRLAFGKERDDSVQDQTNRKNVDRRGDKRKR
ncbi:MAG: hypothetical protein AB8H80_03870 [Planctomycetota bacterium]